MALLDAVCIRYSATRVVGEMAKLTPSKAPDLTSLQLYVRAAELGSFSKVADETGTALAAISRRVTQLEQHYGVQLFIRTGRGVAPTPAGQALVDHANAILRGVCAAQVDITDFGNGIRGTVRLFASSSAIAQLLPNDLADFHTRFPEIRLDIREAVSAEVLAALREGSADVGVIVSGQSLVGMPTYPYCNDHLVVIAPAGFAPHLNSTRLEHLLQNDFVVLEDNTAMTKLLTSVTQAQGLAIKLRVKVRSFDALCRMVTAGFGLGILPNAAAKSFEAPLGLQLIAIDEPWAKRQLLLCTSPNHEPPPAAKQLLAHLSRSSSSHRILP